MDVVSMMNEISVALSKIKKAPVSRGDTLIVSLDDYVINPEEIEKLWRRCVDVDANILVSSTLEEGECRIVKSNSTDLSFKLPQPEHFKLSKETFMPAVCGIPCCVTIDCI